MSDELIRKSDVLNVLDDLGLNLIDYNIYSQLFDTIDNMPPINAVELPCRIGDTVYECCKFCNAIHEYEVVGFRYKYDMVFIECDKRELTNKNIGVTAFFNREQAEKALEDLRNE